MSEVLNLNNEEANLQSLDTLKPNLKPFLLNKYKSDSFLVKFITSPKSETNNNIDLKNFKVMSDKIVNGEIGPNMVVGKQVEPKEGNNSDNTLVFKKEISTERIEKNVHHVHQEMTFSRDNFNKPAIVLKPVLNKNNPIIHILKFTCNFTSLSSNLIVLAL
jgi:hypothetical protein